MTQSGKVSAVYVHIPFCVSKCHYCDFNSIGLGKTPAPEAEYLQALRRDLELWPSLLGETPISLQTVFFGGGTPSLFSPQGISKILEQMRSLAKFDTDAEITLELNPKTADPEKMRGFREVGINRLSIGLQSLEEEILRPLARAHSAQEALQALDWAVKTEFPKINVDLMYALPGQSLDHLRCTLQKLRDRPLSHISAYELIWEEGTPFYEELRLGKKAMVNEDLALSMQEELEAFCLSRGLLAYEVSNYSKPGAECRHNLQYWDYGSFIGVGAGAVSFLRTDELSDFARRCLGLEDAENIYGVRLTRKRGLQEYSSSAADLEGFDVEPISEVTAMAEFMMMGLRKTQGVRFEDFEKKFNRSPAQYFKVPLQKIVQRGWMEESAGVCRLNREGLRMSNEAISEFFWVGSPC